MRKMFLGVFYFLFYFNFNIRLHIYFKIVAVFFFDANFVAKILFPVKRKKYMELFFGASAFNVLLAFSIILMLFAYKMFHYLFSSIYFFVCLFSLDVWCLLLKIHNFLANMQILFCNYFLFLVASKAKLHIFH